MSWYANLPINRKLTLVILLTCTAVLLLAGVTMMGTEYYTARQSLVDDMTVLADVSGRSSTAALSFHRDEDQEELTENLATLQADPHIIAAAVYDDENAVFGEYVREGSTYRFPATAPPDGARFTSDSMELSYPILANGKRIGTIFLRTDLDRIFDLLLVRAAILGVVLLIAVVLTFVVSFRLRRPIADPILALARTARHIAEHKDYSMRDPGAGGDEIGLLTDAFNQMLDEIETGESSLRKAHQLLKDQTQDTIDSINVLVTSASAILATSTQLATGAAQTASAVSETTVTVEQVRQTALTSTENARHVAESAAKVVQISLSGKKSTEEMIEGMQRIRHEVDSIADSMIRLSEHSQTIGQIIGTVDDLAAQSNLLAINASIEAAKAGEHGKGFAIVSQEVRSLAEQSKQATRQVRNILSDIQRATTSAMLVTEQGSKAVEAGVRQSTQAGQSIQTLSTNVTDAATVATQIASSSQQQLIGVDQVAQAMENIKQASQHNVNSAKKLEIAARNLEALGKKLKQSVDRYNA